MISRLFSTSLLLHFALYRGAYEARSAKIRQDFTERPLSVTTQQVALLALGKEGEDMLWREGESATEGLKDNIGNRVAHGTFALERESLIRGLKIRSGEAWWLPTTHGLELFMAGFGVRLGDLSF
jgi:hypothetical protein